MSGGLYGYKENGLCHDLFGFEEEIPRYRDGKYKINYDCSYKIAIIKDPFHDAELSGLMFDMLYMVHILDFYEAGDIGDSEYSEEVAWFKQKWLKSDATERMKELMDIIFQNMKEKLEQLVSSYEKV